MSAPVAILVVL